MNRASKHVKIVLPCRDEGEWLRATIDSILEWTVFPSFEVLVLANGDTLTDVSFLERPAYREHVRLKRLERPLGVGKSINAALAPGDASHYVFLDAHCLLDQNDWLDRVVNCLERNPQASMVQPEVTQFIYRGELAPGRAPDPECIKDEYNAYSITWTWPYQRPSAIAQVQVEPSSAEPYEAMAGGGMAVFTRADTFHRLGMYDPEVDGWYPETMDYCVRAWLLGHPMVVDPTIRVRHRVKERTGGDDFLNPIHGVLRTAYKYLSPRRRETAEILFRRHGLDREVDQALAWIRKGCWLRERLAHLRARIRDDDWLFSRFEVYEERWGVLE